jgi:3-methyladenine DNA glycosylase AlkD
MEKSILHPDEAFIFIKAEFDRVALTEKAPAMQAYMKNKFLFYGVPSPLRKEILKQFKTTYAFENNRQFWKLVELFWQDEHRECQYFACDLLTGIARKLEMNDVADLEKLILKKSWWDTVDTLAASIIGPLFLKHPDFMKQKTLFWSGSGNIWLIRTSIIMQLKFGLKTDWELLKLLILNHADAKEFFIRKAQGWALRQYARVKPVEIHNFVEQHPELSVLTKKEALRRIT